MTAPPDEIVDPRSLPAPPTMFDCFQVNLAALLVAVGEPDPLGVLGGQWWFGIGPGGQPRYEPEPLAERLPRLSGLRLATLPGGDLRRVCREAFAAGRLPMVVTDAFRLPWSPYAGRRHIEHSFVVTAVPDGAAPRFADLYENRTEWGDAHPTGGPLPTDVVTAVSADPHTRILALEPGDRPAHRPGPADLVRENLAVLAGWPVTRDYLRYADARCHPGAEFEELVETCWTIARRRALYARWLLELESSHPSLLPAGFAERFAEEVPAAWQEVNRFGYLALRRIRAGRAAGAGIRELIRSAADTEHRLAARWQTALSDR